MTRRILMPYSTNVETHNDEAGTSPTYETNYSQLVSRWLGNPTLSQLEKPVQRTFIALSWS